MSATFVAQIISTPIDIIVQLKQSKMHENIDKNLVNMIRIIKSNNGYLGFYKGYWLNVL